MPKVVNDPKYLKPVIFQRPIEGLKFIDETMLDNITKKQGINRNNYYLLDTAADIHWLQPTKNLQFFHRFLKTLYMKGFTYVMLLKNEKTSKPTDQATAAP